MVSQADLDRPVWYAAYGSNLLQSRLMAYLEGGPIKGAAASTGASPLEQGAADASAPGDDRPFMLIGWRLVFAGQSRRWNQGGVCAVVPAASRSTTGAGPDDGVDAYGRAWLVSVGQLGDIWRQENAGVGVEAALLVDAVQARVGLDAESGAYRRLAPVGDIDGVAAFTITGTEEVLGRLNQPDPSYQSVVTAGLAETWGLTDHDIKAYLAACPA